MRNLGEATEEFSNELLKLKHILGDLSDDLKGESKKPYQIKQEKMEYLRRVARLYGEALIEFSKLVVPLAKGRTIWTTENSFFNRSLLMDEDQ